MSNVMNDIDNKKFWFKNNCFKNLKGCFIKFSSWAYDSRQLNITHSKVKYASQLYIADGIDISSYSQNVEWYDLKFFFHLFILLVINLNS